METIKISDISLWEAFYWVAKKQSFSLAAKVLKMNTPLLSKKISRLERELGVRLFQRTTRRVSTTIEGQDLLPEIETLIEEARDIEARLESKKEIAGTIRVACLPVLAQRHLAPTIVDFRTKYPLVDFQIDLSEQLIDLVESQIDVAFRVQEPEGAQFIFRKLIPNKLVFCASPAYLKKWGVPKRVSDLSRHSLLFLAAHEDCRFLNEKNLSLGDFRERRNIVCESGFFLTELALEGAGIVIRSLWDVSPLLGAGRLVQVFTNHPLEPYGEVFAVTSSRRYLPQRVQAFIEFVSQRAKAWDKPKS